MSTSTTAAAGQTADQFSYWTARLRGENPDHTRGRAEAGYWRIRQRDGAIVPIFLWREEGTDRLCMIYNLGQPRYIEDEEEFCERTFAYALRNPVSAHAYKHYQQHGRWPEDVPAVEDEVAARIGHNAPPEVMAAETIKELRAEAERWLKNIGEVATQEQADTAINIHLRFLELKKESDEARVKEKAPVLKAQREIDGKWQPVVKQADENARWAKGLTTKFLQEETARKAKEAADKASRGEVVQPEDIRANAGTRGRRVGLRKRRVLKVTHPEALWDQYAKDERFRNDPDVVATLHRLALGDLSIGRTVLGAEIQEVAE